MKPTQEQVIAWAQKYGDWNGQTVEMNDVGLEAAYAAAYEAGRTAEREKVAAWMIQRSYATGHGDTTEDLLAELDWQIVENWNRAMINGIEAGRKDGREWQGLTDEEREKATGWSVEHIEAALKAKNYD